MYVGGQSTGSAHRREVIILLRVGLAISLGTSHLLRSGVQFLVGCRFSGKNNHAALSLDVRRNFWHFCGASQGQGFVIPHDQSDYRAPTRLFWVPALLLVPVILLFLYAWRYSLAPLLDFLGLFGLGLFPVDVYF